MNGRDNESTYITRWVTLLSKKCSTTYGVNIIRTIAEKVPVIPLKNNDFFKIYFVSVLGFNSSSSDMTFVVAKFIPELARVTKKKYVELISPKTPSASEPILFAINISKVEQITFVTSDVRIKITLFTKNVFAFFNSFHLTKLYELLWVSMKYWAKKQPSN